MLEPAYLRQGSCRNSELCELKREDILLDCVSEEPHCIPHDKINLSQRKGWTRQKGGEHAAAGEHLVIILTTMPRWTHYENGPRRAQSTRT